MLTKQVNVMNGAQRLVGELTLPNGKGPFPLVIYGHGFGYRYNIFDFQELAQAGIAGYRFDFGGGSWDSRSDGSSLDMSVMTEAQEFSAVLKQMRTRPEIDSKRVLVCGHSQGGYAACVAGINHSSAVSGMVLLSPAFVISTYAQAYLTRPIQASRLSFFNMTVSSRYFTDLKDYQPYQEMKKFPQPVTIIHGDQDQMVPLKYSQQAAKAFPDCHLVIAHGASHMLEGYQGQIIKDIAAMLE